MEKFIAGDTNKDEKISFEEFVVVSLIMSFYLILKCWVFIGQSIPQLLVSLLHFESLDLTKFFRYTKS